jgi:hypothetical protein
VQPTFGNSNGSEIANEHFQQGASASLTKIDRFQIIRFVFPKCGHNQKRRPPNRCVTPIGSGRTFSNQNNESKYFRGKSAIVGPSTFRCRMGNATEAIKVHQAPGVRKCFAQMAASGQHRRSPRESDENAGLANRLIRSINEAFLIDGDEIYVGASIGIETYGEDACDAETLLRHADIALYRAKAEGRGTYRFFSEAMNDEMRSRVTLSAELRSAISTTQLFLVYQPQVLANDGHIVGVEALIRWRHPRRGILLPASFLPVAESSGLMDARSMGFARGLPTGATMD